MKRSIVGTLVVAFILSGTQAFAQFKLSPKSAKNLANLERVIARAAHPPVSGRPVANGLPDGWVSGNAMALLRVKMPKTITPANKSYATLLNRQFMELKSTVAGKAGMVRFGEGSYLNVPASQEISTPASLANIVADGWTWFGSPIYEDANLLAKNLNEFYDGNADVLIGPDGREAKLYTLPIDGILYKPTGESTPLVLNSNEYFVVYDVQSQTGKIMENKPEVYNQWGRLEDKIWQAMGGKKSYNDLKTMCDDILMTHLHKARLEQLGDKTNIQAVVKQNHKSVRQAITGPENLAKSLMQFPAVTLGLGSADVGFIIELPVERITFTTPEGTALELNNQEHVIMININGGETMIMTRESAENPFLFPRVK